MPSLVQALTLLASSVSVVLAAPAAVGGGKTAAGKQVCVTAMLSAPGAPHYPTSRSTTTNYYETTSVVTATSKFICIFQR